ncbi:chemotaxis protein CheW [bacterium]|nr:chemotaxis protein CheW [bacterium]MCI0602075.1 chemotaxis protein CheW [bacterium]
MEPAKNYIKEWSARLAREKEARQKNTFSAVVIRFGNIWLALPAPIVREIVDLRKVHKIPHRTDELLLGIVNIHGMLHLCVDLRNLLGLEPDSERRLARIYSRMVVVEKDAKSWVFVVDEVVALHRFPPNQVVPLKDAGRTSRGILEWQGRTFDVLDENLLFQKLEQGLE